MTSRAIQSLLDRNETLAKEASETVGYMGKVVLGSKDKTPKSEIDFLREAHYKACVKRIGRLEMACRRFRELPESQQIPDHHHIDYLWYNADLIHHSYRKAFTSY